MENYGKDILNNFIKIDLFIIIFIINYYLLFIIIIINKYYLL